ncbi:MAG: tRNA guanosine(34) transglycosylase Tgt [Planctomycetota bacterium]|jgi:queuine tRNA-ribosyltransferase
MSCFKIIKDDSESQAREGLLATAHGEVHTPAFMPVGTAGAVKGITPLQLRNIAAEIILANTYHMLLRPGVDCVEKIGGLHNFMCWDGPILTDSGGYQIFSLEQLTKVDDEGVEFTSHIDGTKIYLNAKIATEVQNRLGADIIMCFDQCTPLPYEESLLEKAVKRTTKWAEQCKQAHKNQAQLLFGIVQGGTNLSLRTESTLELVQMDFDGYAIGGLSVGEGHDDMLKTVEHTAELLPKNKPRYLMGVGTPADIIAAVCAGVDMFDCVLPTRNGRNAFAFTKNGPIRLRNSIYKSDNSPVEDDCDCYCCKTFTKATIRHFFNVSEMLGPILLSIHNLGFYQRLMAEIRQKIQDSQFSEWAIEQTEKYKKLGFSKNCQNSIN